MSGPDGSGSSRDRGPIGQVVGGRYRVDERLGEGGQGEVYRAFDQTLERNVAIKVPHAEFVRDDDFRARFEREVRILKDLEHPHVARVYDLVTLEGRPGMVLEYLPGRSLTERLVRPAALADVLPWLTTLAGALDFAHARGVYHRDVKPGNVLFDGAGQARLGDFGIAKAFDASGGGRTRSSRVWGTDEYMPPEADDPDALGPGYDQYSLAVVVYRALAGKLPHEAKTPLQLAIAKQQRPPRPLRELRPDLSVAIESVLAKALATKPADRFESCVAFARAFERAAQESAGNDDVGAVANAVIAAPPPAPGDQVERVTGMQTVVRPLKLRAPAAPSLTPPSESMARPIGVNRPDHPGTRSRRRSFAVVGLLIVTLIGVIIGAKACDPKRRLAQWADVLRADPDPNEIHDAGVRDHIQATGLPWLVKERASGIEMILVPPGDFTMGSPESDGFRNEHPAHKVQITGAFYVARTPTTVAQFRAFVNATNYQTDAENGVDGSGGYTLTSYWSWQQMTGVTWQNPLPQQRFTLREDHPVVEVSWNDATAFCRHYSGLRLLTEAEYEYVARAGTIAKYWWGDDEAGGKGNGNFCDLTKRPDGTTWTSSHFQFEDGYWVLSPVGVFASNPWGFKDMLGNVREWCADVYDDQYYGACASQGTTSNPQGPPGDSDRRRVLRGGSWDSDAITVRCAVRGGDVPAYRPADVGFRCARTP